MSWSHDNAVGWSHDTVGWSHDAVGWSHDTVVGWSHDTVVGWSHDTVDSSCTGELAVSVSIGSSVVSASYKQTLKSKLSPHSLFLTITSK